jgi:hypothetical protein
MDAASGQHLLLDGHVRLIALGDLGHQEAPCSDRHRRRELHLQQPHQSAVHDPGALHDPPACRARRVAERLAKALSVDVSHITKKINLLEGICPEAAELLKDRQFSPELGRVIRKMKPTRQVECAELMVSANNMTVAYAEALARRHAHRDAGRRQEAAEADRRHPGADGPHGARDVEPAGAVRLVEQTYGQDVLNLVLARGYLAKLLNL